MSNVLQSPANALTSVDWFKAKLQCEIGPVELNRLLAGKNSVLVVDVRDPESYALEHVPGAMNVPLQEFPKRLGALPRDKTIVCYCWSSTCFMAAKAALELAHRDFKVQEMVGGIKAWKEAGFPIGGAGQASGRS